MKTEHEEQREFVKWVRQNTPHLIFAIPNGGYRGKREAMRLKLEGVTAGVPDLCIPALRLFVEMKTEKGRLSADQKAMIHSLENAGYTVIVAFGCDDAIKKYQNFDKKC